MKATAYAIPLLLFVCAACLAQTRDEQAILSIADVQWVLHNTGDQAGLPAVILRDGKRF